MWTKIFSLEISALVSPATVFWGVMQRSPQWLVGSALRDAPNNGGAQVNIDIYIF